jgi:hypothetical protein
MVVALRGAGPPFALLEGWDSSGRRASSPDGVGSPTVLSEWTPVAVVRVLATTSS